MAQYQCNLDTPLILSAVLLQKACHPAAPHAPHRSILPACSRSSLALLPVDAPHLVLSAVVLWRALISSPLRQSSPPHTPLILLLIALLMLLLTLSSCSPCSSSHSSWSMAPTLVLSVVVLWRACTAAALHPSPHPQTLLYGQECYCLLHITFYLLALLAVHHARRHHPTQQLYNRVAP